MDTRQCEEKLKRKGIKPTANRILILYAMQTAARAVSLSELESMLDTIDKSSIFRTLTLFLKRQLIHAIEDGSGSLKYEVCDGGEKCSLSDMHIHFYCEICHRTFCFRTIDIPLVDLPEGFSARSINYMVKGVCEECSGRQ